MSKRGPNPSMDRDNTEYVKPNKKSCLHCRKEQDIKNYYPHSVSIVNPDGYTNICKKCVMEMIDEDSIGSVKKALKMIDRPFVEMLWNQQKEKGEKAFPRYMRLMVSLPQYKSACYEDGDALNKQLVSNRERDNSVMKNDRPVQMEDIEKTLKQNNETTPLFDLSNISIDTIIKWGEGFTPLEYQRLENLESEMKTSYDITTTAHKDHLKKYCVASIMMDRYAITDDAKYKKYADVYKVISENAKFTEKQRTDADRMGGINSFSQMAEYVEKDGPIPKWVDEEDNDIVEQTMSNMMDFTKNLVLGDSNIKTLVDVAIEKQKKGIFDDEDESDREDDVEESEDELNGW